MDSDHSEVIKKDFIAIIKSDIQYPISLEMICNWLADTTMYNRYSSDEKYRCEFKENYLYNKDFKLLEAKNENDVGDCFYMIVSNDIMYPWFSTDGFTNFCRILRNDKPHALRLYFNKVKREYTNSFSQEAKYMAGEIIRMKIELDIMDKKIEYENKRCEAAKQKCDRLTSEAEIINAKKYQYQR